LPHTDVVFYQDERGRAPVRDWLQTMRWQDRRAYAKCIAAIQRLESRGFELRRPAADILRGGIHELRIRQDHVQLRILYFFHRRNVVVLAHALVKEDRVPDVDIVRALARKRAHEADPQRHTCEERRQDD